MIGLVDAYFGDASRFGVEKFKPGSLFLVPARKIVAGACYATPRNGNGSLDITLSSRKESTSI
jgi:hypothetical protein